MVGTCGSNAIFQPLRLYEALMQYANFVPKVGCYGKKKPVIKLVRGFVKPRLQEKGETLRN